MCHKCLCREHRHSFLVYSSVLFKLIYLPFWGSKGIEPWYDFPVLSTQLFIPSQSIFSWLSILLNKPVSYLWSIFQRHLLSRIFTAPWECSNCFPNDLPELDSGSNLSCTYQLSYNRSNYSIYSLWTICSTQSYKRDSNSTARCRLWNPSVLNYLSFLEHSLSSFLYLCFVLSSPLFSFSSTGERTQTMLGKCSTTELTSKVHSPCQDGVWLVKISSNVPFFKVKISPGTSYVAHPGLEHIIFLP